jgi:nucleoside-diphosphate-sugar epimerase
VNTVLVTGAGGFIGGYVATEFAARGWRVFGTVHRRVPERWEEQSGGQVTLLRADVTSPESLRAAAERAAQGGRKGPDVIVHCAGRASDIGPRRMFEAVNFEPVRTLARITRESDVSRLVFLSTTDVYGLRDFRGEDEDALPLSPFPRNPYPVFKVAAENLIRAELPAGRFSIVRPAQVWGVGDRTLTSRIVKFLRKSPCIVHFGPWHGANRWPLAHARNVAKACFLAATRPEAAGQAIHVLDRERTTMDDFYRIVADVFLPGRRFRTVCLPMWVGVTVGAAVSAFSNALGLDHSFMDPSHYAVYAVSRNLDFSDRRFADLMAAAGEAVVTREEGIAELRANAQRTNADSTSSRMTGGAGVW